MTKRSHCCIGSYIVRRYFNSWLIPEKIAFIFGNIEPDINIFTYLNGTLEKKKIRGHNYINALPRIQILISKLERETQSAILFSYRLGKVAHYIADSFTYPHNTSYKGTLKEHIRYENALEKVLIQKLKNPRADISIDIGAIGGDCFNSFLSLHDRYMEETPCYETDSKYAIMALPCLLRAVAIEPVDNSCIELLESAI